MPFLQYSNIGNFNVKGGRVRRWSINRHTLTDKINTLNYYKCVRKSKQPQINGFKIKPIFVGFESNKSRVFLKRRWEENRPANTRRNGNQKQRLSVVQFKYEIILNAMKAIIPSIYTVNEMENENMEAKTKLTLMKNCRIKFSNHIYTIHIFTWKVLIENI